MLAIRERHAADCLLVTYERMHATAAPVTARLFRFLGADAGDEIVADCMARTSFAALSGGRAAGQAVDGAFFRSGVVGDWRATLTPAMNEMILLELGWMFSEFGWSP